MTKFLHFGLENIFHDKIMKVLGESIGERKRLGVALNFDFELEQDLFSNIYIQALLNKIAPEEELILSYYSEYNKEPENVFTSDTESLTEEEAEGVIKNVRELFREIARERMNTLDTDLPEYGLWSRDLNPDEMANRL